MEAKRDRPRLFPFSPAPSPQPLQRDGSDGGLKGPSYELVRRKSCHVWRVRGAECVGGVEEWSGGYFQNNTFPSPIFSLGPKVQQSRFRLELNIHHWHKHTRYISLYLWLLPVTGSHSNPLAITYTLHVMDQTQRPRITQRSGVRLFFPGDCYGWRRFARYSDLMGHVRENELVIGAEVEVLLLRPSLHLPTLPPPAQNNHRVGGFGTKRNRAGLAGGAEDEPEMGGDLAESPTPPQLLPPSPPKPKLSKMARKKMKLHYKEVQDGPVQIHTAQHKLLRVNKLLLAARSPKLFSLIRTGAGSGESVDLGTEETEVVRSLVEFLYTNRTGWLEEGAGFEKQKKLFLLARKYQIQDLLRAAFKALCGQVCVGNWVDLVELCRAEETELKHALPLLNRFFTENRAKLMDRAEFQQYLEANPDFLIKQLVLDMHGQSGSLDMDTR